MNFDIGIGYWVDVNGQRFVRNEFDPTSPTFIAVTEKRWCGQHLNRRHVLTWPGAIDPSFKGSIERVLRHLMQKLCPSSLNSFKQTIAAIVAAQPPEAPFVRVRMH